MASLQLQNEEEKDGSIVSRPLSDRIPEPTIGNRAKTTIVIFDYCEPIEEKNVRLMILSAREIWRRLRVVCYVLEIVNRAAARIVERQKRA